MSCPAINKLFMQSHGFPPGEPNHVYVKIYFRAWLNKCLEITKCLKYNELHLSMTTLPSIL